jgi:nucleotidyltransferase/DNA polymerase involved in DNA repair
VSDNLKGIPTAWETAKEIRARIYEETRLTATPKAARLIRYLAR